MTVKYLTTFAIASLLSLGLATGCSAPPETDGSTTIEETEPANPDNAATEDAAPAATDKAAEKGDMDKATEDKDMSDKATEDKPMGDETSEPKAEDSTSETTP
ncbi:hypothetical protein [Coleofasciculus sp.]|uniref:hypothetical protein n=1 Tax=Coleofasciculus sp. TaxID=3100458 RepID=UPI0039F9C2A2